MRAFACPHWHALHRDDFDAIVDTVAEPDVRTERGQPQHGQNDLYPFVLEPQVLATLRFVHSCVCDVG
jgi:hypothetical protein